jgi:hypothetical protein
MAIAAIIVMIVAIHKVILLIVTNKVRLVLRKIIFMMGVDACWRILVNLLEPHISAIVRASQNLHSQAVL